MRSIALISVRVVALLLPAAAPVAAASSIVECGQIVAYTAPDPVAPSTGSLTIGLLTPFVVADDAAISPAIAGVLPTFAGSGPSCIAMEVDANGVVTAMDFAPSGTVAGPVVFDSAFGGYVFDSRVLIPTFITDQYPGLEAVFATSEAAGTNATATFTVNTTTGQFTGFDARAAFCGPGRIDGNGDGRVGDAVIDGSLLTAVERAALVNADSRRTCASVHSHGQIDTGTGQLTITTDLVIRVAADDTVVSLGTAPPTDTPHRSAESRTPSTLAYLVCLIAVSMIAVGGGRRRPNHTPKR